MTHDYRTTFVLSQLASKKELVFDVAFGKYEEGVTVVFYDGPRGDNEKFTVNKDGSYRVSNVENQRRSTIE